MWLQKMDVLKVHIEIVSEERVLVLGQVEVGDES